MAQWRIGDSIEHPDHGSGTVTVLRGLADGESDMDLTILVTRRVWRGDQPPVVGMEIEGSLWLQGRLWMPIGDKPGGRQSRKDGRP